VKTELICLPCFQGQIERTLGYAGVNGDAGSRIRRRAGLILEQASLDQAPARISTLIHRLIREETGLDPYKQVKDAYTRIALGKLPALGKMAAEWPSPRTGAPDILEGSVRAAIAGNVIDFGIYERFDLDRSIEESFRLPLSPADYLAFAAAVERSANILYLCDNAGEIVFDRVLLDTLRDRGKSVTAVVKGAPVINDATRDDAAAAGLAGSAMRVIDNGNDGIGTLLELCSGEFMDAYRSADLIVSKGQANYETLAGEWDNRTFFLFKVKCPVVARSLGRPEGDIVLMGNG
jgi:uncharacterized protein with ATP-grasp and redox domains